MIWRSIKKPRFLLAHVRRRREAEQYLRRRACDGKGRIVKDSSHSGATAADGSGLLAARKEGGCYGSGWGCDINPFWIFPFFSDRRRRPTMEKEIFYKFVGICLFFFIIHLICLLFLFCLFFFFYYSLNFI